MLTTPRTPSSTLPVRIPQSPPYNSSSAWINSCHWECLWRVKIQSCGFPELFRAFDRVGRQGFVYEMNKKLPLNYCQLLESYLVERKLRVTHQGVYSTFKPISAGVPQGSVSEPLLYILYTVDISTSKDTALGTFADDVIIITKHAIQSKAIEKLQVSSTKFINGLGV